MFMVRLWGVVRVWVRVRVGGRVRFWGGLVRVHSLRRAAHCGSASIPLRTESRSQRLCTNGVISSARWENCLKLANHMARHIIALDVSVTHFAIGQFFP